MAIVLLFKIFFAGFKTSYVVLCRFVSFYVVLCHYVENGFAGYCIFASVNKRNRVGATYGECTFSARKSVENNE